MEGVTPTEYGRKTGSVRGSFLFTVGNWFEHCMTMHSRVSCQRINRTDSRWGFGSPTCCRNALKTPWMSLPREPLDAPSPCKIARS